jgi:hypothetical protein
LGNRWTWRGLLRSAGSGNIREKWWSFRLELDWPSIDIFDPVLSRETVSHRRTFIILRW